MTNAPETYYWCDYEVPMTFLPVGVDTQYLEDITQAGMPFRVFIDPVTNIKHDCYVYYQEYLKQLESTETDKK